MNTTRPSLAGVYMKILQDEDDERVLQYTNKMISRMSGPWVIRHPEESVAPSESPQPGPSIVANGDRLGSMNEENEINNIDFREDIFGNDDTDGQLSQTNLNIDHQQLVSLTAPRRGMPPCFTVNARRLIYGLILSIGMISIAPGT